MGHTHTIVSSPTQGSISLLIKFLQWQNALLFYKSNMTWFYAFVLLYIKHLWELQKKFKITSFWCMISWLYLVGGGGGGKGGKRGSCPPAKKSPLKNTRNQNTYLNVWGFRYGVVWLPLKNHQQDQVRLWNGFWKWHFRAFEFQKFLGSMPPDTRSDSCLRSSSSLPPHTQISSYSHGFWTFVHVFPISSVFIWECKDMDTWVIILPKDFVLLCQSQPLRIELLPNRVNLTSLKTNLNSC